MSDSVEIATAPELAGWASNALSSLNDAVDRLDGWSGLGGPQDAARVLAELAKAVGGLQHCAAQLTGYLEYQLQSGRLEAGSPYHADPLAAVDTACAALDHVQVQAGYLARLLADAAAPTHALYAVDNPAAGPGE